MPKMPFERLYKEVCGYFYIDDVEFNYKVTVLDSDHEDAIDKGRIYDLTIISFYEGYPTPLYEFRAGNWITKPRNENSLAKRALEYVLKMYS